MLDQINELANEVSKVLDSKKAVDISLININNISTIADYFIVCSGTSMTHIKALSDEIYDKLLENYNIRPYRVEGYEGGRWILMDYGDILVHIFHKEDRDFYDLERLWADAKNIKH